MLIGDMAVPLFGQRGIASWALLNLILLIVGIALATFAGIRAVMRKVKRSRDNDEEIVRYMNEGRSFSEQDTAQERMSKRSIICLVVTCILAVLGVILFIITQDMTRTMVFIDHWTLLHVLFVALQVAALILLVRKIKSIVTYEVGAGRRAIKEQVEVGDVLEEPKAPARKGYAFDGWYTDSYFNDQWEFNRVVDRNMTLYAKWNPTPENVLRQTGSQVAPA